MVTFTLRTTPALDLMEPIAGALLPDWGAFATMVDIAAAASASFVALTPYVGVSHRHPGGMNASRASDDT